MDKSVLFYFIYLFVCLIIHYLSVATFIHSLWHHRPFFSFSFLSPLSLLDISFPSSSSFFTSRPSFLLSQSLASEVACATISGSYCALFYKKNYLASLRFVFFVSPFPFCSFIYYLFSLFSSFFSPTLFIAVTVPLLTYNAIYLYKSLVLTLLILI